MVNNCTKDGFNNPNACGLTNDNANLKTLWLYGPILLRSCIYDVPNLHILCYAQHSLL